MEREMAVKLSTDDSFMFFCRMVDSLKEDKIGIWIPFKTAILLLSAGIDYVKGKDFEQLHQMVEAFLMNGPGEMPFYDYFISEVMGL